MASHPRFNLFQGKGDTYYFSLTATNGQVILSSQGYADKKGAKNGIASVKKNSADDSKYDRKESKDGKHYFNLVAANQQIIGTSQMYASKASLDNGVQSVKANAPKAEIHEE